MDPDQEPSDRVRTVCLYFSYICSGLHRQMPFSGEHLSSALDEWFSRNLAEIDLSVF